MGYSIRTLDTLAAQAKQFITGAIPGAVVSLWANTWRVIGKVMVLLDFEHELRRKWIFDQLFASTADELWLRRHGYELGLTPTPASRATGSATVAATPGTTVEAGVQFTRGDGAIFVTRASGYASGNSVSLLIQAQDAGSAGNTDAGATLTLVDGQSVPDGLGTQATVDPDGITGGAEAEGVEPFRTRVLERKRNPPQGGSAPDYVEWTKEALPTIAKVYVDSFSNDARSVWVAFTVTDQADGIPTPGDVDTVQSYVNDPVRRPVTARVFAVAPIPTPVDVLIADLSPDTPDTRAAIGVELQALFAEIVAPGTPSQNFVLYREWIGKAIGRAVGEDAYTVTNPATNLVFTAGQMPTLGDISYG